MLSSETWYPRYQWDMLSVTLTRYVIHVTNETCYPLRHVTYLISETCYSLPVDPMAVLDRPLDNVIDQLTQNWQTQLTFTPYSHLLVPWQLSFTKYLIAQFQSSYCPNFNQLIIQISILILIISIHFLSTFLSAWYQISILLSTFQFNT